MARKSLVLGALIMVGVALALPAQTSTAVESALRRAGYTVQNPRTEGGLPTWDLRHDDGVSFSLSMAGGLTDVRIGALNTIRENVFTLAGLEIRRARVVFTDDRAVAIVIPRSYRIAGRDYADYLPSGMQFIVEDALFYDFRMLADNLALRINGQFIGEQQFADRIARAIDNPAGYIESTDPLFLSRRLDEQGTLIEDARAVNQRQDASIDGLEEADREIIDQVERYVEIGEQAIFDIMRRAETNNRALREEIAALSERHEELVQRHESLLQDYDDLQGYTRGLSGEFETLREGMVALEARRLFGSLRELNPEAVARVVELRRADSSLERDDALARVNDELPEDAEPLHKRHVQAIYALYFNDYR
jgi:hypothetical protein